MKVEVALEKFDRQLVADGRSKHTRAQYRRHVRLFGSWYGENGVESVCHETVAVFLGTPVARLRPDGTEKRATSMNALRSSLRCFFAYLHGAGITSTNPARLLRRARCGPPPPRGMGRSDQKRLLETLRREAAGSRDHVLFEVLLGTGIRVGSAVALRVEDVDLDEGTLEIRSTKGDAPLRLPLGGELVGLLATYAHGMNSGPLFPGRGDRSITTRHVHRLLRYWCERAGIRRPCGPHALRHSFAMRVYERTGDIALVQAALGHQSILSTVAYARCCPERVRAFGSSR